MVCKVLKFKRRLAGLGSPGQSCKATFYFCTKQVRFKKLTGLSGVAGMSCRHMKSVIISYNNCAVWLLFSTCLSINRIRSTNAPHNVMWLGCRVQCGHWSRRICVSAQLLTCNTYKISTFRLITACQCPCMHQKSRSCTIIWLIIEHQTSFCIINSMLELTLLEHTCKRTFNRLAHHERSLIA